jgi:uncharacterized membrane protein YebE (DUF533 family)
MNPEHLVHDVLRSVLGGRRKKSKGALKYLTRGVGGAGRLAGGINRGTGGFLTRPSTLLGALGVAWGIFETLQHQNQGGPQGASSQGSQGAWGVAGLGMGAGGQGSADAMAAAPATGPIQQTPLPPLPNVGVPGGASPDALRMMRLAVSAAHADGPMNDQERAAILRQAKDAGIESVFGPEMTQPRPLAEIVAGVNEPAERATLYVLAYTVLRADEQVTGAERIYLAQLANLLGLDPATVAKLETDTGQRIDALGDQGQLGG